MDPNIGHVGRPVVENIRDAHVFSYLFSGRYQSLGRLKAQIAVNLFEGCPDILQLGRFDPHRVLCKDELAEFLPTSYD